MKITQYAVKELPTATASAVMNLQIATWPEAEATKDEPPVYTSVIDRTLAFVATEKEVVIGYAEIFPRVIYTSRGPMEIWALASVCVAMSHRGTGIGRRLVQSCFKAVKAIPNGVSLFQTGVPGFYEKLNCAEVHNKFTNGQDTVAPHKNPFWDDHVMIFPSNHPWPEGSIDLNGKGF